MSSASPEYPEGEEFSLERLSQAYAKAMEPGRPRRSRKATRADLAETATEETAETDADSSETGDVPPTPMAILEAMLFVGQPDNSPLSAEDAASVMRDVEAEEIPELVATLNDKYAEQENAYEIVEDGGGYQMRLREEFARLRDVFYGRTREITLSQAAVDVLALVAYRQPILLDEINKLRGIASGGTVRQLVRRRLIRFELDEKDQRIKRYFTTRRMLNLLGLESLDDLPQSDDA
ncbi:MAG: SMC-Scp complex subunit ScpB [Pirellulales bacterium]|nr:SMC-Scp complex subunit ScpB [Pirellulales bacterium]